MNRWVTSAIALAVGMSGSFAAISAARSPDRDDSGLLGPLDVDRHCHGAHGPGAAAILDSNDSLIWICATMRDGQLTTHEVRYDDACQSQYGDPSFAGVDDSDPGRWQCFSTTDDD